MKRSISPVGLLFTSTSAILGSGWLFGAYYAAGFAGPASTLAWVIGGLMIIVIAFVFAEICTMIPITASSTRIPHLIHGSTVSFIFSWIIWLTYLALGPTEVQAIMQYLSIYYPSLLNPNASLTGNGFLLAFFLLAIISIINIFSLRWLIRANNILTILKIIIPLIISITIIYYFFSLDKITHPSGSNFMPYGFHGILTAISAGGVIFTFNAFKLAAEMAGEARNPKVALPVAIIGSVVICMALYLLLQIAFLSSLTPENIANGWNNINMGNKLGPFAAIATADNLSFLKPLVFIGAIIGPFAAALVYCSSSARSLYGMSENGYVPSLFQKVTTEGNPIFGIIIFLVFGSLMFAPFHGWQQMVQFLTSLLAITYAIAPVNCYTMRVLLPNQHRDFKLPLGKLWSLIAFFACTLMVYWSGWFVISKSGIVVALGLIILSIYRFSKRNSSSYFAWNIKESLWFWLYLIGITIISYSGNFGGGKNYLSTYSSLFIIFIFCGVIINIAAKTALSSSQVKKNIEEAILTD
jgi:amino acid transporter